MDETPRIRFIFMLTKMDCEDFDRDTVTQMIGIMPTSSSAPELSKGHMYCNDIKAASEELPGLTLLPATEPPYQILKHACWSIEMPKVECWCLDDGISQLESILKDKDKMVRKACQTYDLSADVIIRVFAMANSMPDLTLSPNSISFWAAMGAAIGFDFYLD